jgi:hypothetical protein
MNRMCKALFVLMLALLLVSPAQAGGWSVVVLDSGGVLDPTGQTGGTVEAGAPFTIGFTVLQHGKTPVAHLTPTLHFSNGASGERLTFSAQAEGKAGHYVASVTLPDTGTWNWEVDAFGPPAPMAAVTVVPMAASVVEPAPAAAPVGVMPLLPAAALVLAVLGIGGLLLLRRQQRAVVRS